MTKFFDQLVRPAIYAGIFIDVYSPTHAQITIYNLRLFPFAFAPKLYDHVNVIEELPIQDYFRVNLGNYRIDFEYLECHESFDFASINWKASEPWLRPFSTRWQNL